MAKKKQRVKIKKDNASALNVWRELAALSMATFSVFLLLTLLKPDSTGILGRVLSEALSYLFGRGAFFFPLLVLFYALVLFFSYSDNLLFLAYGLSLIYVSTLTLIASQRFNDSFFVAKHLKDAGGLFGSLLAYPLETLLGQTGTYITLIALMIAGILITLNRPINELLAPLRERTEQKRRGDLKAQPTLTKLIKSQREKTVRVERPEITQPIEFSDSQETIEEEKEQFETPSVSEDIKSNQAAEYRLPPISLLNKKTGQLARTVSDFKKVLETTLSEFNIPATIVGIQEGPTVTTFEVQLEPGVPVRKLSAIQEDIALALATPHIRIITPLPGKSAIGIEVPNKSRELVTLRELLETEEWLNSKDPLLLAVGKNITGVPFYYSLKKMPHMLIAGATGSGKSVCLNSIILTILFKAHPDQVKLLLIDPKRVEFTPYTDIPHLMAPVIVDPKQAASALAYAVQEMENRYRALSSLVARDIDSYNRKAAKEGLPELPYIVIIIDELADLMLVCSKEVEDSIVRLAQMARAVGIHLIVATQRPSADIITGLIKSNITTRIAFSVRSQVDSRVILDSTGAEKLVGQGDMLFLTQSLLHPVRLQAPYVSEEEIERVSSFVKSQRQPAYIEDIFNTKPGSSDESDYEDELFEEAVELILTYGQASTSFLQRKLKIGYARAARIMDMLEASGIVGPQEGAKPREVLISREEWEARKKRFEA
jgi:S-DNA-T family DNA segregation ATPase FtsK/SpoIIIE